MSKTPEVDRKHAAKGSRKRSSSWSCRWLPFSCGDNDDIEAASPISRSLTDDLFWDQPPPGTGYHYGSGTSGTHSTASQSCTSGATASTLAATASLNSIIEDDSIMLGSDSLLDKNPPIVTASRCDGPRCYNCGSASVHMLGGDLPDAQSHPLMAPLQHESFCNRDCIWTYLFSRQAKCGTPAASQPSNNTSGQ